MQQNVWHNARTCDDKHVVLQSFPDTMDTLSSLSRRSTWVQVSGASTSSHGHERDVFEFPERADVDVEIPREWNGMQYLSDFQKEIDRSKMMSAAVLWHRKNTPDSSDSDGSRQLQVKVKNTFFHAVEQPENVRRVFSAPAASCIRQTPATGQAETTTHHGIGGYDGHNTKDSIRQSNGVPAAGVVACKSVTTMPMPPEWANVLTVMVRSVPAKYTWHLLVEEINSLGFEGCFDFLHLPVHPRTGMAKGYAFINFTSSNAAWNFKCLVEGRPLKHFRSEKLVSISEAMLQGYEANHQHFIETLARSGRALLEPKRSREKEPLLEKQPPDAITRKHAWGDVEKVARASSEPQPTAEANARPPELVKMQTPGLVVKSGTDSVEKQSEVPAVEKASSGTALCHHCGLLPEECLNYCVYCGSPLFQ